MTDGSNFKQSAYGTISYLPAAFGGVASSVVIRDLLDIGIETPETSKMMKGSQIKRNKKKPRLLVASNIFYQKLI